MKISNTPLHNRKIQFDSWKIQYNCEHSKRENRKMRTWVMGKMKIENIGNGKKRKLWDWVMGKKKMSTLKMEKKNRGKWKIEVWELK